MEPPGESNPDLLITSEMLLPTELAACPLKELWAEGSLQVRAESLSHSGDHRIDRELGLHVDGQRLATFQDRFDAAQQPLGRRIRRERPTRSAMSGDWR